MFPFNKEPTEKSIFFLPYFQLIVVLVIKLEVNHLMYAIGVIISKKITGGKEISVFGELRIGKFGLAVVVTVFPQFFLLVSVFSSE